MAITYLQWSCSAPHKNTLLISLYPTYKKTNYIPTTKKFTQMEKSFKTFDIQCNLGFEDRVFLTKDEWNTYRRKIAVRYIKKTHTCNCEICGMPFTDKNPAQHAHKIGFKLGIIYLGLTPDFVNSHINIRSAHREKCNSTTELNLADSMELIKNRGITQLPDYLPDEIHKLWLSLEKRKMESDDR